LWCSLILILMLKQFVPHTTSYICRVPTSTWCFYTFLG
jgi:hypothetical protein